MDTTLFAEIQNDPDFQAAPLKDQFEYLDAELQRLDPEFAKAPRGERYQYLGQEIYPNVKQEPAQISENPLASFAQDVAGAALAFPARQLRSLTAGNVDVTQPVEQFAQEQLGTDPRVFQPYEVLGFDVNPLNVGNEVVTGATLGAAAKGLQTVAKGIQAAPRGLQTLTRGLASNRTRADIGRNALVDALYGASYKTEGGLEDRATNAAVSAAGYPVARLTGRLLGSGIDRLRPGQRGKPGPTAAPQQQGGSRQGSLFRQRLERVVQGGEKNLAKTLPDLERSVASLKRRQPGNAMLNQLEAGITAAKRQVQKNPSKAYESLTEMLGFRTKPKALPGPSLAEYQAELAQRARQARQESARARLGQTLPQQYETIPIGPVPTRRVRRMPGRFSQDPKKILESRIMQRRADILELPSRRMVLNDLNSLRRELEKRIRSNREPEIRSLFGRMLNQVETDIDAVKAKRTIQAGVKKTRKEVIQGEKRQKEKGQRVLKPEPETKKQVARPPRKKQPQVNLKIETSQTAKGETRYRAVGEYEELQIDSGRPKANRPLKKESTWFVRDGNRTITAKATTYNEALKIAQRQNVLEKLKSASPEQKLTLLEPFVPKDKKQVFEKLARALKNKKLATISYVAEKYGKTSKSSPILRPDDYVYDMSLNVNTGDVQIKLVDRNGQLRTYLLSQQKEAAGDQIISEIIDVHVTEKDPLYRVSVNADGKTEVYKGSLLIEQQPEPALVPMSKLIADGKEALKQQLEKPGLQTEQKLVQPKNILSDDELIELLKSKRLSNAIHRSVEGFICD